jgi:hypothetical protein
VFVLLQRSLTIIPSSVFIIRFAERRIDQLLDPALLDYSPLSSEFDSVQFESEWSFLRPFSGKKKAGHISSLSSSSTPLRLGTQSSPTTPNRPPSPSVSQTTLSSSTSRGLSSLRQSFSRVHTLSTAAPLHSLPSPADLISFLTALHTLLTLSEVNPVLTTQLWSQVMYWTSCKACAWNLHELEFADTAPGEIFNRVLTRKKYLCR